MSLTDLRSHISSYYFAVTNLHNPIDPSLPWKPHRNQIGIYNMVDFGYDIARKEITPPSIPEVVVIIGPRQDFGKSEGVCTLCAALLCRIPNYFIGIVNNTQDNAEKMISRIRRHIELSDYKGDIENAKVDRLFLSNGSKVFSYGQTHNIRGNSFTLLIVDEAAQIDEALLRGSCIPTTRVAGAHRRFGTPSIILLSTPGGNKGILWEYYRKGITYRKVGCRSCHGIFDRNEFESVKWPVLDVPKLRNCECGANDWEYVDGDYAVYHIDPWDHPYKTVEEIQHEIDMAGNTPLARQELLGEFVMEGEGVFREEWMISCINKKLFNTIHPDDNIRYVMAVDFGHTHDATVITIGHNNEVGHHVLDYIKHIPSKGGVPYEHIRTELLFFVNAYNPVYVIPDSTGIGDPIVERLGEDINELRTNGVSGTQYVNGIPIAWALPANPAIRTQIYSNKKKRDPRTNRFIRLGFYFDTNSKFELIQYAVESFAQAKVEMPDPDSSDAMHKLWEEFINFAFEYSDSNHIIYGVQASHDDIVIAFALLLWGLRERPTLRTIVKLGERDQFVVPI